MSINGDIHTDNLLCLGALSLAVFKENIIMYKQGQNLPKFIQPCFKAKTPKCRKMGYGKHESCLYFPEVLLQASACKRGSFKPYMHEVLNLPVHVTRKSWLFGCWELHSPPPTEKLCFYLNSSSWKCCLVLI